MDGSGEPSMSGITTHTDREIGVGEVLRNPTYEPNYSFPGSYVDEFHEYLGTCPMNGNLIDIGIPGWLRREDALKLYELAYFANGDVLEFGTNRGLSTFILSKALQNSRRFGRLVTMELSAETSAEAKRNLASRGVTRKVRFMVGDADISCGKLALVRRKFGFAFIDHSHAYEHMEKACGRLSQLMAPSSFCVFHDYNDGRNSRRTGLGEVGDEYGVKAAIEDHLCLWLHGRLSPGRKARGEAVAV
jgi:hypothetical protein